MWCNDGCPFLLQFNKNYCNGYCLKVNDYLYFYDWFLKDKNCDIPDDDNGEVETQENCNTN